jgi:hypothetical protein
MEDIRFPIGQFVEQPFSETQLREWLLDIRFLPQHLEAAVSNLDAHQLDASYREGGWSIKQIVHHLSDSHMNAFIRSKLAITEDNPIIKPYDQDLWAETTEVKNLPINISITMLHALHLKWHELFIHLTPEEWNRTVMHPEYNIQMSLWYILGKYSWHSRHHAAQIISVREKNNWG